MNRQEILEKINGIFAEVFEDDSLRVGAQTTADDIEEWDSLAHLQLIDAVEKAFGIRFKLGEIHGFANVGDLCDCVAAHLE